MKIHNVLIYHPIGVLLFMTLTFAACEKGLDTGSRESLETIIYSSQEMELSLDSAISPFWNRGWNYALVPGARQVVFYSHSIDPRREVADDESTNILLFEFDQDQPSFTLQDSALWHANCLYNQICFCGTRGYYRISKGMISGQKLSDNTWSIDFDIYYDQFHFHDSTYHEIQYQGGEVFKLD